MKSVYDYFFKKKDGETLSLGWIIIFGSILITVLYLSK